MVGTEQKQLSRPELAASDLIALQSSRRLTFLTELSAAELEVVWVIKQECEAGIVMWDETQTTQCSTVHLRMSSVSPRGELQPGANCPRPSFSAILG